LSLLFCLIHEEIIKKYEKLLSTVWSLYISTDVTKNAMGKHKNALWRSKYKDRYIIVEKYTMEKQNNTAPKLNLKRILKRIKLTRYRWNGVSEGGCKF
jgi:hypothetical protein